MTLTLATIAGLLVLLPGVGFIVGVNFADKNVREIVFRNTPAEIGYVISISLIVHLLFGLIFPKFNVAELVVAYAHVISADGKPTVPSSEVARQFLTFSLIYFLVTACAGLIPGFILGRSLRPLKMRFFVKHGWMLDLVGMRARQFVFARVLLTPYFVAGGEAGNWAIGVEGVLSDSYFNSDGTLLYLAFKKYVEKRIPLGAVPGSATPGDEILLSEEMRTGDYLLIEGRSVATAQYVRLSGENVATEGDLDILRRLEAEDDALGS